MPKILVLLTVRRSVNCLTKVYLSVHFFSSVRILCEFHFFRKEFVAKYTVIISVLSFCRCMIFVNFNALLGWPEEITRRSEEHTSELQSRENLVCRLLLEK